MNFYLAAAVVFNIAASLFTVIRQAQMLQQSSYFPSRYLKWLRGAFSAKSAVSGAVFVLQTVLLAFKLYLPLALLVAFCAGVSLNNAIHSQKKAIKKLVFTARVKRQLATLFVINAAFGVLSLTVSSAFFVPLAFFAYVPAAAILLVRFVNTPAEKLVTRYYINDAKRILREHSGLTVIGITGSYGKTSTKYILAALLEQKYNVVYTPASFNTPLGVVRTIREKIRPETQIFIAEMGAKNVGDIKEICDIVNPDIGLVTSVGPQHLDTFKTIENVTATKLELANSVLKKGGKVFLNYDNEYIRKSEGEIPCISYGKNAEVVYGDAEYGDFGARFSVTANGESIEVATKLLGLHNVQNLTGAAAVALHLGVKPADIAYAAAKLKPVEHRLQLKGFLGGLLIDDAYNANPEGCLEAVRVLGSFKNHKKVIVTPGLIELGEREYDCNRALGKAAAEVCDEIVFVGIERSKPLNDGVAETEFSGKLSVVPSFAAAMEILRQSVDSSTVVLIENDLPDNYLK